MNYLSVILVALSLTFDTFAVSVSSGIVENKMRFWQGVKIASIFGILQGLMPVIGWLLGSQISNKFNEYNYWIAFILLTIISIKMLYEAIKDDDNQALNPFDLKIIFSLGIATSIDALIVGFSFAFLETNIVVFAILTGIFTFLVAMIGMLLGKKAGDFLGNKAEIIGAVILFLIGLKILLENIL